MKPLQDRIAVVTGANRGIGKAICEKLAGAGAHVVMAVRDVGAGEEARRVGVTVGVRLEDT